MEWYNYFYYQIYFFAKNISDDYLNEWKPLLIISVLECMLLEQLYVWYTVFTKKDLDISNIWLFIIALSIVSYNYYIFLYGNKWKSYNHIFNLFSKRKRNWSSVILLVIIIAVIGGLICAFYQMSLIDWKKYNSSIVNKN